jgi:hypothetical protein
VPTILSAGYQANTPINKLLTGISASRLADKIVGTTQNCGTNKHNEYDSEHNTTVKISLNK